MIASGDSLKYHYKSNKGNLNLKHINNYAVARSEVLTAANVKKSSGLWRHAVSIFKEEIGGFNMDATFPSEKSVNSYQTVWRQIPEDSLLQLRHFLWLDSSDLTRRLRRKYQFQMSLLGSHFLSKEILSNCFLRNEKSHCSTDVSQTCRSVERSLLVQKWEHTTRDFQRIEC
jgi:hypothetical protein